MIFKNKIVLVTGGGSGLGRQDCIEFAKRGATLVVADIDADSAQKTIELINSVSQVSNHLALRVNVADSESVQQLIKQIIEHFNHIDVLINNAGVVGEMKRTHEVSEDSWSQVINIDLKGTFLCAKYVIPLMLKNKSGVIVNVASVSGFLASNAGVAYTAAKHGVVGLTKQLAYEYGHDGIRIVGIAPGVIETPLTKDWTCEGGPFHELTMEAPAGRYGKSIDVAALICFLASDAASFMHGHTYPIDGGSIIR